MACLLTGIKHTGFKMGDKLQFMIQFIRERQEQSFSGAVKFGIERGSIVSIGEANAYDAVLYTDGRFSEGLSISDEINNLVKSAVKISFNGTVVLRFFKGVINGYAYSRTFKGEELKRLMGM